MANLIKAREWAKNTVVVGGSRVSTTLKLMNIQAERRREHPLEIGIVELSQKMEQERIIAKVGGEIRRKNAKLVIFMVEWGFNSDQGYHSRNSKETLKKIVELEMRLCKHTHAAAVRKDVAFLLYPGVTDAVGEPSELGRSAKALNDYTVAWLRERGIRWDVFWANVGVGVRDREGNIPPVAFRESLGQVLTYAQGKAKIFTTHQKNSVVKYTPSPSNTAANTPSTSNTAANTHTSPPTVSEPWIQGDHTRCYLQIKKLENEIACLHVQVAQQLERTRAADARREEAEEKCRDLIRIQERIVMGQGKENRVKCENGDAKCEFTGTWVGHEAQSG